VVRPGCYISHDDGMYLLASPFADQPRRLQPALELWSYVTSIPEPGLAFLGFGRRDVPYDHGLPVPIAHLRAGSSTRSVPADATVTELHDQHAALRYGGFDLHVGDRVVVGLSHPCGGFDRWQVIPIIDDDGVVVDAVRTYF
jgi:D-serine deaminase-like pyridoxal phosphate-dependent protein